MPASPSRPSTTIARRCDAFCTDRILHRRFCLSTHTENGDLASPPRHSAPCLRSSPCGGLLPALPRHWRGCPRRTENHPTSPLLGLTTMAVKGGKAAICARQGFRRLSAIKGRVICCCRSVPLIRPLSDEVGASAHPCLLKNRYFTSAAPARTSTRMTSSQSK